MDSAVLQQFCSEHLGQGEVTDLRQLSGGASMESWRFNFAGMDLILRLRPQGLQPQSGDSEVGLVSLEGQAVLIQSLFVASVLVPEVVATLPKEHPLGDGFIMRCVEGEGLPGRILRKPEFEQARGQLSFQCAQELAKIHRAPTDLFERVLVQRTPAQLLEEQYEYYQSFGSPNPIFELVFCWLRATCPEPQKMTLVHADFRVGNLLVTPEQGLTSVLDWELAHIGDPMRDVSFICTPSWRFGNYELEAGGVATRETWLADYESATGQVVDRDAFNWWLSFNTLWWGVTCMRFGSTFKDGSIRTVERAVIGRRVSEVEIDLLLQLDDLAPRGISVPHCIPELQTLEGDVSYQDVANSVAEWVDGAVLPSAEGHQKFEARVAANALGIATRALAMDTEFSSRRNNRLQAMGETEDSLIRRLANDADVGMEPVVWTHLVLSAFERIDIDQPHYAGAKVARARWLKGT